ncbi:hypothetical protein [Paenibacillus flagellatus]|uniref:Uncharacterized protein n=1 Tax=Paenibacillus flagellatus TaxID=2211139 RepID=A0A2V5KC03_9BACL|nr:hypothetical protein [Paenibacillus flagellatus]PYI55453.1 hypothetical protein DLM86_06875 [Paenibacillus flagellatus]
MSDTKLLVQFDRIVVNSIGTNAGIFVGTNLQYGWSSHSKTNASITDVTGDGNEVRGNVNVIYDNDLIDTPIDDRDVILSAQRAAKAC